MKLLQSLTPKQRQRLTVAGVLVAIITIVAALSFGISQFKSKPQQKGAAAPSKKMSLMTEKVEKDLWVASEGQNIKALEKSNEEMKSQIEQLQKGLTDTKEETKKTKKVEKYPPFPPPKPGAGLTALPSPQGQQNLTREIPPQPKPQKYETPGSSIRMFKDEVKERRGEKAETKKISREQGAWLPSGSFMKAVLLSGLDAPTSGGSQAEPYPVLLGITDISTLPNRFKMNLKECFVVGAGYGNISDERAYIRAENLSCVRNDGKVIDVPLKGHVVGEDGKLGMRGRLVSKQGQQIAMAIFAGTLSGLGTALRPQQPITYQELTGGSTGAVYRPPVSDVLESAALGGVGSALDKVAEHYLKMAEKLFPVIEVDAGRHIEIMVLKGQELKIALRK